MRGVSVRVRPRLPAPLAAPDRRPTLYSPGDECDRQPRPQELDPPRDRGSRRPVRPRRPRRRRAPVPPHAGRGLPSRQGPAADPRACPRPDGDRRRGRRAPRPGRVPRGDHRAGDRPADQRGRRDRRRGGGQAAALQGDRPGPPRGPARRLHAVQLRARDRDDRRAQDRQGRRGAARPERPAGGGRGPRGEGRRLGRDRVHRHPGRHGVRGRPDRADAADPRRGPPHPGLRGERRRAQAGRRDRVRHHVPRGLPGADARRPAGALQGGPQGAAREDPPRRRRRVRPVDGRLPGHGRAQGGHRASASAATRSTGRATSSATRSSSTPSPTRRSSSRTC